MTSNEMPIISWNGCKEGGQLVLIPNVNVKSQPLVKSRWIHIDNDTMNHKSKDTPTLIPLFILMM